MKNKRLARWALIAVALLALAGAGYALVKSGLLEEINSVEDLRALIGRAGPMAGVAYFLLQMMTVIVAPIPSNVTMMAGALALGFWPAMILGVLAVICGSVIVFLAARALGRNAVRRFLDRGVMERYLPVIEEKQDMFLFLTMLFPFFPDDALCILAGLTTISLRRFVLIMAAARPWGLVFAALLGSGSIQMPVWGWVLLAVPMIAVFILAMRYSRQIEEKLFSLFRRISGKHGKGAGRR
ncbi:MAG TPA: TVP38/TMEM64 family protein [Candidatus Ventricola gallistercoris]|nr:TVP38/TMEM64 family protein [Candidatus Ventricola gallistercoris]